MWRDALGSVYFDVFCSFCRVKHEVGQCFLAISSISLPTGAFPSLNNFSKLPSWTWIISLSHRHMGGCVSSHYNSFICVLFVYMVTVDWVPGCRQLANIPQPGKHYVSILFLLIVHANGLTKHWLNDLQVHAFYNHTLRWLTFNGE